MSAALIEAGEQQGAAGRALRMMYARLGGDIAGAREEMQAMGIEVVNQEGNMKTLKDIMIDLKEKGWDELTGIQQQNIAQTVSGNRHYVRFIKLMEGLGRVTALTDDALYDFDSAQEEVGRRLETNAVTLEKLEAQIENVDAAIGTALLPGMIAGKQATLLWNQELEKFVSGNYGEEYEKFANFMVNMREVSAIVGPFIQMQIAARGIAVAFGTMRSVLAAIRGETIAVNRQFHKSTSLMDISNQTTENMRKVHKAILATQGEMNEKLMFAAENEKRMLQIKEQMEAAEKRRLIIWVAANEDRRKAFILDEQRVQWNERLLNIGNELKGHMKEQLKLLQNQWEMDERMSRTRLGMSRLENGRFRHATISVEKAREHMVLAKEELRVLTMQMSAQRDRATFKQREVNSMQAMLAGEKLRWKDMQGTVYWAEGAREKYEAQYRELRRLVGVEQGRLKAMEGAEYRLKGELFHLSSILEKEKIYNEMLEQQATLEKELLALMDAQSSEALYEWMNENNLLVLLEEELQIRAATADQMKEQGANLHKILLESMELLGIMQADNQLQKKKSEHMMHQLKMVKAQLGIFTGTLNVMSIGMPMMASMSNDADTMRKSMIAMNLAMIPMMGHMAMQAVQAAAAAVGWNNMATAANKFWMTLGGIASILGAIYIVNLFDDAAAAAERSAKRVADLNEEMLRLGQTLEELESREGALIRDPFLQARLGLGEQSIAQLAGSADEAKRIYDDLLEHEKTTFKQLTDVERKYAEKALEEVRIIVEAHEAAAGQMNVHNKERVEALQGLISSMVDEKWWGYSALETIQGVMEEGAKILGGEGSEMYYSQLTDVLGLQATATITELANAAIAYRLAGKDFSKSQYEVLEDLLGDKSFIENLKLVDDGIFKSVQSAEDFLEKLQQIRTESIYAGDGISVVADDISNLTEEIYNFSGAREELFFGGQYGNVTGSLYRQVVQQGVGTLYHKNEVIMSNNFHGFFNEEEAAERIIDILNDYFAER
tara:strand:+ start:1 stop:3018 length:3018 start_codon:yes stop_codon:yes gene_type:complete